MGRNEKVTFNVLLLENKGMLTVVETRQGPRSARIIASRWLPDVKSGSSPEACFRAIMVALGEEAV